MDEYKEVEIKNRILNTHGVEKITPKMMGIYSRNHIRIEDGFLTVGIPCKSEEAPIVEFNFDLRKVLCIRTTHFCDKEKTVLKFTVTDEGMRGIIPLGIPCTEEVYNLIVRFLEQHLGSRPIKLEVEPPHGHGTLPDLLEIGFGLVG